METIVRLAKEAKRTPENILTLECRRAKPDDVKRRQIECALRRFASVAVSLKQEKELMMEKPELRMLSIKKCTTGQDKGDSKTFMKMTRNMRLRWFRLKMTKKETITPLLLPPALELEKTKPCSPSAISISKRSTSLRN